MAALELFAIVLITCVTVFNGAPLSTTPKSVFLGEVVTSVSFVTSISRHSPDSTTTVNPDLDLATEPSTIDAVKSAPQKLARQLSPERLPLTEPPSTESFATEVSTSEASSTNSPTEPTTTSLSAESTANKLYITESSSQLPSTLLPPSKSSETISTADLPTEPTTSSTDSPSDSSTLLPTVESTESTTTESSEKLATKQPSTESPTKLPITETASDSTTKLPTAETSSDLTTKLPTAETSSDLTTQFLIAETTTDASTKLPSTAEPTNPSTPSVEVITQNETEPENQIANETSLQARSLALDSVDELQAGAQIIGDLPTTTEHMTFNVVTEISKSVANNNLDVKSVNNVDDVIPTVVANAESLVVDDNVRTTAKSIVPDSTESPKVPEEVTTQEILVTSKNMDEVTSTTEKIDNSTTTEIPSQTFENRDIFVDETTDVKLERKSDQSMTEFTEETNGTSTPDKMDIPIVISRVVKETSTEEMPIVIKTEVPVGGPRDRVSFVTVPVTINPETDSKTTVGSSETELLDNNQDLATTPESFSTTVPDKTTQTETTTEKVQFTTTPSLILDPSMTTFIRNARKLNPDQSVDPESFRNEAYDGDFKESADEDLDRVSVQGQGFPKDFNKVLELEDDSDKAMGEILSTSVETSEDQVVMISSTVDDDIQFDDGQDRMSTANVPTMMVQDSSSEESDESSEETMDRKMNQDAKANSEDSDENKGSSENVDDGKVMVETTSLMPIEQTGLPTTKTTPENQTELGLDSDMSTYSTEEPMEPEEVTGSTVVSISALETTPSPEIESSNESLTTPKTITTTNAPGTEDTTMNPTLSTSMETNMNPTMNTNLPTTTTVVTTELPSTTQSSNTNSVPQTTEEAVTDQIETRSDLSTDNEQTENVPSKVAKRIQIGEVVEESKLNDGNVQTTDSGEPIKITTTISEVSSTILDITTDLPSTNNPEQTGNDTVFPALIISNNKAENVRLIQIPGAIEAALDQLPNFRQLGIDIDPLLIDAGRTGLSGLPDSSTDVMNPLQVDALEDEENSDCGLQCEDPSADLSPVCGSDGQVYPSECHLRKVHCNTNVTVGVWEFCRGKHYLCPAECLNIYDPVCGQDFRIYRNLCHMRKRNCGKKMEAQDLKVCYSRAKEFRNYQPCPDSCLDEYKPVCGSDGHVYASECILRMRTCGQNVQVAELSRCAHSANCPDFCIPLPDPVCGSDGKLYLNFCRLRLETCGKGITRKPKRYCDQLRSKRSFGRRMVPLAISG